jgi:hypothetical protein
LLAFFENRLAFGRIAFGQRRAGGARQNPTDPGAQGQRQNYPISASHRDRPSSETSANKSFNTVFSANLP